jgi:hypothetical protein
LYARQSKNTEAERKACGIRLRAERKTKHACMLTGSSTRASKAPAA